MNTKEKKIAIMYDFDGTLSAMSMQEYKLFPEIMGISWEEFISGKNEIQRNNNMDTSLAYLFSIIKTAKENNVKITRELLRFAGESIEYFPGVETWFDRINQYARERGVSAEHYIISSGNKEILEGASIAKHFKKIYASEFYYNDKGEAEWISSSLNYTNKTQFIFRINKGCLEIYNDSVNDYMEHEKKKIPFENMVYIGDGFTDVPCMQIVKDRGGKSIAVYDSEKSKALTEDLLRWGRVNTCALADYSEGSSIDLNVKRLIDKVAKQQKTNDLCKD